MFTQRFIRSVIEAVWNQAPNGGDTFYTALTACRDGKWSQVATGWQVESSSGAGYHTSFHIPASPYDTNDITPARLQDMFQLIIEKYRTVKNCQGIQEDQAEEAGSSVFVHALSCLFPTIKGYSNDYSYVFP